MGCCLLVCGSCSSEFRWNELHWTRAKLLQTGFLRASSGTSYLTHCVWISVGQTYVSVYGVWDFSPKCSCMSSSPGKTSLVSRDSVAVSDLYMLMTLYKWWHYTSDSTHADDTIQAPVTHMLIDTLYKLITGADTLYKLITGADDTIQADNRCWWHYTSRFSSLLLERDRQCAAAVCIQESS